MSTFPSQLANRAAQTIAATRQLVNIAHQRLNTLGSQVAFLTPGDWETLTLEAGWGNVSGYIPAQVRLLQNGLAQIVGHIQGGTVTNGTVIAVLATGYYNPVHAHSFTANVLAGASAVSVSGSVSGLADDSGLADGTISSSSSSSSSGLPDGTIGGSSSSAGLPDGTIGGTSAGGAATSGHTHGGGSFAVNNGQHTHSGGSFAVNNGNHSHGPGSYAVSNGHHQHGSSALVPATPINYNTVILNIDTSGNLTIQNCSAAATQISFNENLPLVTS